MGQTGKAILKRSYLNDKSDPGRNGRRTFLVKGTEHGQRSWCWKELQKGGRLREEAAFIRLGRPQEGVWVHSKCNRRSLKNIRRELHSVSVYFAAIWRRLSMEAGRPVWRW